MLKTIIRVLALYLMALPINASELEQFKLIYNKQCATCHGVKGDGKGRVGVSFTPPATNFTAKNNVQLSQAKMMAAIRDGVPGSAMSAYGRRFDDDTLAGLADYIQRQFMGEKSPLAVVELTTEGENQGRAIYAEHCSACHGDNGDTAVWAKNAFNPAPRNFTSAQSKADLSLERMLLSVAHGRPGTAMMPFEKRLNNAQIHSVVTFIRQTFMQLNGPERADTNTNQTSHDAVDMTLSFLNGLQGDVEVGENFFQSNCFACHGKKGDGKGPRAHFNVPRPRNFTSAESRRILNRPRLFSGISRGKPRTVMPAWSSVLSEQQIADIAEYVFQAFVQVQDQKKKR